MGCLKLTYHPKEDSEIKNLLFLQKDAPSKNFFLAKKCLNEYQYHLKDHLGNVRTTFAVRDDDFNTSFEVANGYFDNYDAITKLNVMAKSGSYSNRVSAAHAERMGISKTFLVSEGDKVSASVYAKYIEGTEDDALNGDALVDAFVAMLSGTTVGGETPFNANGLENGFWPASALGSSDENEPEAYFNYILFDKSFNYVNGGFRQVTSAASDDGTGTGTHELLAFEDIIISQDGYLMIFVSNESETLTEVYFDDLMINHHKTEVVQADDYYPFGMVMNEYTKDYTTAQNYLYNGKELQEETGWLDYGWRSYDAAIGRFFNTDAFADKYYSLTPYQYGANNPIKFVDINGDSLMLFKDGVYVTTVDNGKKEITGYNQLTGEDPEGNKVFTGGYGFGFNDLESDGEALRNGEMTVERISDSEINQGLDESGANNEENQNNRFSYIIDESRFQNGEGESAKLDFWGSDNSVMRSGNVLHVAGSKYGKSVGYNPKDFSNFMWGMAGRSLGFDLATLRLGAQFNHTFYGREDNQNKSYRHKLLDDPADQRAIVNGYRYGNKAPKKGF